MLPIHEPRQEQFCRHDMLVQPLQDPIPRALSTRQPLSQHSDLLGRGIRPMPKLVRFFSRARKFHLKSLELAQVSSRFTAQLRYRLEEIPAIRGQQWPRPLGIPLNKFAPARGRQSAFDAGVSLRNLG